MLIYIIKTKLSHVYYNDKVFFKRVLNHIAIRKKAAFKMVYYLSWLLLIFISFLLALAAKPR